MESCSYEGETDWLPGFAIPFVSVPSGWSIAAPGLAVLGVVLRTLARFASAGLAEIGAVYVSRFARCGPRHPRQIATASSAITTRPKAPNTTGRNRPPQVANPAFLTRCDAGRAPDVRVDSISDGRCGTAGDALSGSAERACSAKTASFCRSAMCDSVKAPGLAEKTSRIPSTPRQLRIGEAAIERNPRLRQTSRSTSGSFSVSAQCWIFPARKHSPEIQS